MTWLLSNDDGIDAPGIQTLQEVAVALQSPAVMVAPKSALSGCAHQVTTTKPIHVEKRSPQAYAVDGMPADCVRLALQYFCPQPSWVLSGVNAGGNMGADIYISGTIAAVREAAFYGFRGIAISQYRRRDVSVDWERASRWLHWILPTLMAKPTPAGTFWNVNLPSLTANDPEPEMVFCPLSTEPLPSQYRVEGDCYRYTGNYQHRDRTQGTDVDVCFSGQIAVTQISL